MRAQDVGGGRVVQVTKTRRQDTQYGDMVCVCVCVCALVAEQKKVGKKSNHDRLLPSNHLAQNFSRIGRSSLSSFHFRFPRLVVFPRGCLPYCPRASMKRASH